MDFIHNTETQKQEKENVFAISSLFAVITIFIAMIVMIIIKYRRRLSPFFILLPIFAAVLGGLFIYILLMIYIPSLGQIRIGYS